MTQMTDVLLRPLILGAVITFAAAQPVLAAAVAQPTLAAAQPSVFQDQGAPLPPSNPVSEKIISTYVHNSGGPSGIVEAAGAFTQIDDATVSCPTSAKTCTVTVAADVEANGGAHTGNEWAICTVVDGTFVDS